MPNFDREDFDQAFFVLPTLFCALSSWLTKTMTMKMCLNHRFTDMIQNEVQKVRSMTIHGKEGNLWATILQIRTPFFKLSVLTRIRLFVVMKIPCISHENVIWLPPVYPPDITGNKARLRNGRKRKKGWVDKNRVMLPAPIAADQDPFY